VTSELTETAQSYSIQKEMKKMTKKRYNKSIRKDIEERNEIRNGEEKEKK
jgi:hypothetical protein